MLAEWSSRRLTIPFVTWDSFSLVASTASYTIGASGDVEDTRPEVIDRAFIRDGGNVDHEVMVVTEAMYMKVRSKSLPTGRPSILWYNPTVPDGTLYVFPVPDTVETMYYSHVQAYPEPATTDADLVVPRAMDPVIMWNLAVRLADMLDKPVSPTLQNMAEMSLRRAITQNAVRRAKNVDMTGIPGTGTKGAGASDTVSGGGSSGSLEVLVLE